METALSLEFLHKVETKLGKDVAKDIIFLFDSTVKSLEEKTNELAVQKKLELKDELTKELATKADLALFKSDLALFKSDLQKEIIQVKAELSARIDKLEIKLNFLIILMIIFIGLMNPVVTKLISNWLKLGL